MSDFDDFDKIDPKAVARRVVESREKINLTQIDLARRSGSSQQTICNLERGAVKVPRNIPMIAAALNVKPRFLLTGKSSDGVPLVKASGLDKVIDLTASNSDFPSDMEFVIPTRRDKKEEYKNVFAIYVEDSAMSNSATTGDVVVFDTAITVGPGMLVIMKDGGRYTVRKARSKSGGSFEYVPENNDYPTLGDFGSEIVGVITEIRKLLV